MPWAASLGYGHEGKAWNSWQGKVQTTDFSQVT